MRYDFDLTDEKTLENDTVKISVQVTGPADAPRADLESRVRQALTSFIPGVNWAYSALSITTTGYPMFNITAGVRIPASANDDLERKAQNYAVENPQSKASIKVVSLDASMPLFKKRDGFAELRKNLFKAAQAEAEMLGSPWRVLKIDFNESYGAVGKMSNAGSTANYGYSDSANAIGSYEKVSLTANVTLTDGQDEPKLCIAE